MTARALSFLNSDGAGAASAIDGAKRARRIVILFILNGTSLTVSSLDKEAATFQVWFIPETLRNTTFSEKCEGDCVNVEIDRGTQVVVDTIRDFLEERLGLLKQAIEISPAALELLGVDAPGLIKASAS
jgi:hypothetical protein